MKFSLLQKPRALSLTAFSWDDNSYSKLFKACGGCDGFIKVWTHNKSSPSVEESIGDGGVDSSSATREESPPDRRSQKRVATKLPPLQPVSKVARIATCSAQLENEEVGEIDDKEIEKFFIGMMYMY